MSVNQWETSHILGSIMLVYATAFVIYSHILWMVAVANQIKRDYGYIIFHAARNRVTTWKSIKIFSVTLFCGSGTFRCYWAIKSVGYESIQKAVHCRFLPKVLEMATMILLWFWLLWGVGVKSTIFSINNSYFMVFVYLSILYCM